MTTTRTNDLSAILFALAGLLSIVIAVFADNTVSGIVGATLLVTAAIIRKG